MSEKTEVEALLADARGYYPACASAAHREGVILATFNAAGCAWLGWYWTGHGHAFIGASGYITAGLVFGMSYADWCLRRVFERDA